MFITLEGVEGSGKSSVIGPLQEWLQGLGLEVLVTLEPGGSRLGRMIRPILLDARNDDLSAESELFLYMADRAQHVRQVLMPALASGKIVLCDRFSDSTIAYQGYGRGVDLSELRALNKIAQAGLLPDLTLLFDVDVEIGIERARRRNSEQGIEEAEGRFEAEQLEFHQRVRDGYLMLAEENSWRFRVVDAMQAPGRVLEQARTYVLEALGA